MCCALRKTSVAPPRRRALGEDNLVTVFQQLRQSAMLGGYAHEASEAGADPDDLASHRAECFSLASAAVAALERRRVAGTLLDGKCSAAEVAWPADQIQHDNPRWSAAVASSLGALVGYEEFLHGGKIALHLVAFTDMFAEECSPPQLFAFVQHALRAAELMQQPRRHGDMALNIEADFTDALRDIVAVGVGDGVDEGLVEMLAAALQRLERSGVLEARRTDARILRNEPDRRALNAVVQSSLTAPGLRTCALASCGAREAHPTHFKSCAACRTVVYCCREHQGWPAHKKACKAARKAAAADDGAGPSGA